MYAHCTSNHVHVSSERLLPRRDDVGHAVKPKKVADNTQPETKALPATVKTKECEVKEQQTSEVVKGEVNLGLQGKATVTGHEKARVSNKGTLIYLLYLQTMH